MKVALDAMMPEEIGQLLTGREVVHAGQLGWRELTNGDLLDACEANEFTALITKDANMPY